MVLKEESAIKATTLYLPGAYLSTLKYWEYFPFSYRQYVNKICGNKLCYNGNSNVILG